MISANEIKEFIQKIPPTPEVLKKTLKYVNEGELTQAAKMAEQDLALSSFLKDIVNRPIYGFKGNISNIPQIFGILGVSAAQQLLHQYMTSLLLPKDFKLFQLNAQLFTDLQTELTIGWNKILHHLNINDKEIQSTITLLPATIIVCEGLFCAHLEEVELLRSVKQLDYNTILQRLSKKDFFDIAAFIAKKWELSPKIPNLLYAASGTRDSNNAQMKTLGAWMHLLLFQTLSKPEYIKANLNDFIEFNVEYVTPIFEDYMQLMEIQ